MRNTIASAAALSAAALTFGLAAPAAADSIGVTDPTDIHHGVDLQSVTVTNNDKAVRVVLTHLGLRRDPRTGSGGAVYLDTDPKDAGPELVFLGGYFEGTDYHLVRTEGFGRKNFGAPVDCGYELTVDYVKEQSRMRISRDCLKGVGKVRVAVKVSGTRTDGTSTGLVDWLGEPRSFTRWVARG